MQELQAGFQPIESIPAAAAVGEPGRHRRGDPRPRSASGSQAATQVAEDADALVGDASPPIPSEDGEAVQVFLPLEPRARRRARRRWSRTCAPRSRSRAPTSFVTGPAGHLRRLLRGFEGIDGLLLLAAFGVVLLILLVVYRSPLLPLLVIATAGLALTAANAVAYLLADGGVITVNGQSQGIAAILVVGAATDYGLLLVARFREELRREQSKYAAMRIALRRSWEPIVASGATVVLGVLCLLLSDLGLQPRARADLGGQRRLRRPRRPDLPARRRSRCSAAPRSGRSGRSTATSRSTGRGWPRVAALVGRRPRRVLAISVAGPRRRRGLRAHLRRRRHPDLRRHPGRVERRRRPGGARPALRGRQRQPDGDHHARGDLAGGRRGRRGDRRRRRRSSPFTGPARRCPAPTPSSSTGWSGWTSTLDVAPDSVAAIDDRPGPADGARRGRPEALVGGETASNLDARESARPRPAGDRPDACSS